jgi:hypothetical protein
VGADWIGHWLLHIHMRRTVCLLVKPRGNENLNQAVAKGRRDLDSIRNRHIQEQKAKEDRPYGHADRHVIEAWEEIEKEDKEELMKKGVNHGHAQKVRSCLFFHVFVFSHKGCVLDCV